MPNLNDNTKIIIIKVIYRQLTKESYTIEFTLFLYSATDVWFINLNSFYRLFQVSGEKKNEGLRLWLQE